MSQHERALLRRAWHLLDAMASPDGEHRALRSSYSSRGVCETLRPGQESPLCIEWRALVIEIAELLEPSA